MTSAYAQDAPPKAGKKPLVVGYAKRTDGLQTRPQGKWH